MTFIFTGKKIALKLLPTIGNLDRALKGRVFRQKSNHLSLLGMLIDASKFVWSCKRMKIFMTVLPLMQVVLRLQIVSFRE